METCLPLTRVSLSTFWVRLPYLYIIKDTHRYGLYRSTWCTRRFIIGSRGSRLSSAIDFCHDCLMAAHSGRVHGYEFYLQRIGVCTPGWVWHIFSFPFSTSLSLSNFFHVKTNNSQFIRFHLTRIRYFVASIVVHYCLDLCSPSIIRRMRFPRGEKWIQTILYKYAAGTAQATSMRKSLDIRAD